MAKQLFEPNFALSGTVRSTMMAMPISNPKNFYVHLFVEKDRALVWKCLSGICLWVCLIRLPVTSMRDSGPQSWEAVLSFASAHHLQWGRDVIFTFGPLGFLTSDFYWGNFFWPIVIWAGGFALAQPSGQGREARQTRSRTAAHRGSLGGGMIRMKSSPRPSSS